MAGTGGRVYTSHLVLAVVIEHEEITVVNFYLTLCEALFVRDIMLGGGLRGTVWGIEGG